MRLSNRRYEPIQSKLLLEVFAPWCQLYLTMDFITFIHWRNASTKEILAPSQIRSAIEFIKKLMGLMRSYYVKILKKLVFVKTPGRYLI